jgi:cephalosporin-C deacetylase-like acetyl esterase
MSDVSEHPFAVTVEGEDAPAVLWAPSDAAGPRPVLLLGHGATQHKRTPSLVELARHYVQAHGYAVLAMDARDHGDRIVGDAAAMAADVLARVTGAARDQGGPSAIFKTMRERARRIVPEWIAALDVAQSFPFVTASGPVGYWGLSMGMVLGVPFVAAEPRITCAVFGLGGVRPGDEAFLDAARRIQAPVEFVFQWDDAIARRETGLAFFDALGSREKTMHINPGGHGEIPPFERAAWDCFFVRHLGRAST